MAISIRRGGRGNRGTKSKSFGKHVASLNGMYAELRGIALATEQADKKAKAEAKQAKDNA